MDMEGFEALTGTAVQVFHERLLSFGLPFRVNIRGKIEVHKDGPEAERKMTGFALFPIIINPLQVHGLNTWYDFLEFLLRAYTAYIESLRYQESSVIYTGMNRLELTYLPLQNLQAFERHLRPMAGGAKGKLPKELVNKNCVLNIDNKDNQCLRCCLIGWSLKVEGKHAERWSNYVKNIPSNGKYPKVWQAEYKDCSLNLSCLPTDRPGRIEDLDQVELMNPGLGIYVYFWHHVQIEEVEQSFQAIARVPDEPLKVKQEVYLLLFEGHWYPITELQRFMSQRNFKVKKHADSHKASHTCHRCLDTFYSEKNLNKHLTKCQGWKEEKSIPPRLPSKENAKDKCIVRFENHHQRIFYDRVVYKDIETFFDKTDPDSSNTKAYGENRHIASIGLHAVTREGLTVPDEFCAQLFVRDGNCDPFTESMRKLLRLCTYFRWVDRNEKPLVMSTSDEEAFEAATSCEFCGVKFGEDVTKCRDHNHHTGLYRAALCSRCNGKACTPKTVRVFTHNGTGYDHHFYILGLARLKSKGGNLREFIGAPEDWLTEEDEVDVDMSDMKLDVLAESSEKIRSIKFGIGNLQLEFLDSCKFMKDSLSNLVESLKGNSAADLSSAFPNMVNYHPWIKNHQGSTAMECLKHLLKKLPFPYESLKDESFWSAPVPTNKKAYFNNLKQEAVDDKEFDDLLLTLRVFNITTGRQLHDIYLQNDILQLADVSENFRTLWHETTGLDPFHKMGLPGAAWDNLLKNSKCKIENITEECCNGKGYDFMKIVDDNIRGGLSCAFVGHCKANNPNCPEYKECDPSHHTWIRDYDVNSLYPHCMSMMLPVGDFDNKDDFGPKDPDGLKYLAKLLDYYEPDHEVGYMLVADYEIPEQGPKGHDYWDYAPVVNRQVEWHEVSKRQQQVKQQKYLRNYKDPQHKAQKLANMMRTPTHQKLVPDLNPQKKIAIHIERAQHMREHGVQFTKLHEVYSWSQARIFKDVLGKHAAKRAVSTDEAVRDMEKLAMNTPYGKTLENKRRRGNGFKIHTDIESFQRNAAYKRSFEFRIQHYCEEDESFLGITSAKGCKPIVLDTPRLIGWAVLEYAKLVMSKFHYDVMKPLFGQGLKLVYTDTDSLYYEICWPTDPNDYIAASEHAHMFDLSQTARYHDTPNKNKLGCFKYEGAGNKKGIPGGDNEIVEMIGLGPKSYIKRMAKEKKGSFVSITLKGVPGSVAKKNFADVDHYKQALYQNKVATATFRRFESHDHIVQHCETTKIALSCENDKVFQISPGFSRPLGHYKNRDLQPVAEEWALEDDEETVNLALKLLDEGKVRPQAVNCEDDDCESTAAASNSLVGSDLEDDD